MKWLGRLLRELFVDGLSGMATGLFATLIIGTIIQQIGLFIPGVVGDYLFLIGKLAAAITGAGIGAAVAAKLNASPLVVISAATSGMVGAFASKIIAGSVLTEGMMTFAGVGEPLGAYIAAMVCVYIGRFISGKTKVDILITPSLCILSGSAVGLLIGPPISSFMMWLGSIINWGTEQAPLLMGIIVSVVELMNYMV